MDKRKSETTVYDAGMAPLERFTLDQFRRELVPHACGNVLEIGAGTGVNLAYYHTDCVDSLTVTDGDEVRPVLRNRAARRFNADGKRNAFSVEQADVEMLPYPDNAFDTVIATLVFCSVSNPQRGFQEIRRVLKPGGSYLFLEHVLPGSGYLKHALLLVNPVWMSFSRGCNLTLDTFSAIHTAGFDIDWRRKSPNGVFIYGQARNDQSRTRD